METLILTIMKEVFWDSTVIVIAHRVSTAMECDRVVVMEDGQVIHSLHTSPFLPSLVRFNVSIIRWRNVDLLSASLPKPVQDSTVWCQLI